MTTAATYSPKKTLRPDEINAIIESTLASRRLLVAFVKYASKIPIKQSHDFD
ncbi:unnamed protein product [Protopolystoma xenopodis]|uniref:Uncharacterized protein n=1 Tax=Protopolystoma xenopodis TaxID=117903 RepID=A0A3S5CRT3_9PLAT|nr:unnamed protein product [Protopolystoma xenopodis]